VDAVPGVAVTAIKVLSVDPILAGAGVVAAGAVTGAGVVLDPARSALDTYGKPYYVNKYNEPIDTSTDKFLMSHTEQSIKVALTDTYKLERDRVWLKRV
jgi:hypothetical protein